jgi:hypothetical protein
MGLAQAHVLLVASWVPLLAAHQKLPKWNNLLGETMTTSSSNSSPSGSGNFSAI